MTLKLDKVAYLASVFFIISILDISFNFSGLNLKSPLYLLLSLFVVKDILNANISWYVNKSSLFFLKRGFYLYFLLHPVLIAFFGVLGMWGLLESISPFSILLSGTNMALQVIVGIFFLVNINSKNFQTVNKLIYFFVWLFLAEFVISSIFLINSAFGTSGEFVGYINSEWMISLFALLAFHFSMSNFVLTKKKKYILYGLCFVFLGYVAQLRIFQLGILIYIFFTVIMLFRIRMSLILAGTVLGVIAFIANILVTLDSLDAISLYDRFYLYAKQLDLISNHFIFGVGGNVSEKYYNTTDPYLITVIANSIGLGDLPVFAKQLSLNEYLTDIGWYTKRSSHSTPLDFIGDYGVLGILLVFLSIFWPIKILGELRKKSSKTNIDLQTQQAAISVLSLVGFNSLESSGQYIWVFLLLFAYMLHLDKTRVKGREAERLR